VQRYARIVATLLATAATTGCRLDPAHPRPEVDTPRAWRDGTPQSATLAHTAWFAVYQDEALQTLIRAAIDGNLDLRAALARIDEARALAVASGAALSPNVDLSASAGGARSTRARAGGGDRNAETYALGFDLTWELDVFGRVRSQTAAAQARYFGSVEGHRDVTIRLVADVARAYFELRNLDEQLAISQRTLTSRGESVTLAKDRFEGRMTSELDFRQAEGEYFRTKVVTVETQRRIAVTENRLSVLLGRAPHAIARGRAASAQPVPPAVPAGLPSDLLQRRPDVRLAEQALVAETALVGAARANLYPRIALTGSAGWESDALSDLFTSPSTTGSLIAGLLQPLFNAGRNRSLVEAQCARMRLAMEQYRQTVLEAFREVEDALVDYRRYTEQRGVEDQRVGALRKVRSLAETRYVGGVGTYLDVLDAQRQLFDAELEQARTVTAQLVALTRLYKALGGGWYGPDAAPSAVPETPAPGTVALSAPPR